MRARIQKWFFALVSLALVWLGCVAASAGETPAFPRFRHVDKAAAPPQVTLPPSLTLLADDDFAPFSFKSADGKVTGLAVQLALAACADLRVQCQVKALPYAGLAEALQQKQGDLILTAATPKAAANAAQSATRPYFYSYGAFFVRSGGSLTATDAKALAGRRVGYVEATAQAQFLKTYYDRATLVPFASEDALFEALRTGGLDLAFADSLHGLFWARGTAARGCCQQLGGAYADKSTITRGLSMITRSQDEGLRDALDYALDRLQERGQSAKIFANFMPASPF